MVVSSLDIVFVTTPLYCRFSLYREGDSPKGSPCCPLNGSKRFYVTPSRTAVPTQSRPQGSLLSVGRQGSTIGSVTMGDFQEGTHLPSYYRGFYRSKIRRLACPPVQWNVTSTLLPVPYPPLGPTRVTSSSVPRVRQSLPSSARYLVPRTRYDVSTGSSTSAPVLGSLRP